MKTLKKKRAEDTCKWKGRNHWQLTRLCIV